ncbi:conjugative transposon protein TraN [Mucilaginibacter sp. FT3.2]|uniref:conjugative transposon protein TraN n=1 Tax=Mucilaginibacter sp. FT3.2 TaxID=2723090 RepID=UPI001614A20D|nr:conjugative transposon protein TraN [Mucilaginibacter sp. FT3.2]MBB6234282.1 conjugative transposon TraN protein [Mucilaginibacter sp. FT3.2]
MKKIIYCLAIISTMALHTHAQTTFANGIPKTTLPVIYLPPNNSIHLVSPEPIQYADISTKNIIGDLPLKNVFRIRLKDSVTSFTDAIITIAGESFIAQYHILPVDSITGRDVRSEIEIQPAQTHPLDISGVGLSHPQLKQIALNLFTKKTGAPVSHSKAFGLKGYVNHIYAFGEYLFLDLSFENKTNLGYHIDEVRFKVDDKEVTKASNVQSVDITPEYQLLETTGFKKHYRNIFVLKKLTFPGNKVLHIEISEKQVSGRVVTLNIAYQDVLDADIIPIK